MYVGVVGTEASGVLVENDVLRQPQTTASRRIFSLNGFVTPSHVKIREVKTLKLYMHRRKILNVLDL